MPNLVTFEPGYAVIGAVYVPISAAGTNGELRVGGDAGPVLRPLAFGERTRIVARMATSPQAAEGLGAALIEAALVEAGEADGLLVEILAMTLAGADAQGPLFSAAALTLAQALGWDMRRLNALEAAEVDRLALHLGGPPPAEADDGWSRIVFVAAPPSSPETIRRQLALQLLARAAPDLATIDAQTDAAPALPSSTAGAVPASGTATQLPPAEQPPSGPALPPSPSAEPLSSRPEHTRPPLGTEPGREAPGPAPGVPRGTPGGASSPAQGAWHQAPVAPGAGAASSPQIERPAGGAPYGAGASPGARAARPAEGAAATERGPLPRLSFQLRAPSEGRPPLGRATRPEPSGAPTAAGLPSNGVSQANRTPAAFAGSPAALGRPADASTSVRASVGYPAPAVAERGLPPTLPPLAPPPAHADSAVGPSPGGIVGLGAPGDGGPSPLGIRAAVRGPAALVDGAIHATAHAAPPTLAQLEQLVADELADTLAALLDHEADLRGVER